MFLWNSCACASQCDLVTFVPLPRWEASEPGRSGRAALLWTQRQAAKVAETHGGAAPGSGGGNMAADEEWIKARAAAIGVPMDLEIERQKRSCIEQITTPFPPEEVMSVLKTPRVHEKSKYIRPVGAIHDDDDEI